MLIATAAVLQLDMLQSAKTANRGDLDSTNQP
jgi:hypothetical protein